MENKMSVEKEQFYKVYCPEDHLIFDLANVVLHDDDFYKWSGSCHKGQHHYGTGQLAQHTLEVLQIMFAVHDTLPYELDKDVMFLSAIYHDIGKTYDYGRRTSLDVETFSKKETTWYGTDHKRNIHHISRSAMIFHHEATLLGLDWKLMDKILHCILSHHTRREYGSPVAPNSREAWLLTLSDNMSARMYDCETWDYIVKKK